jgi:sulfate adenylyltransferase
VLHALVRKNYGCTHFIVGRDHAGVGAYYGTFQAQELLASLDEDELGIVPLRFDNAFYCGVCGAMATQKTCPHPTHEHLALSGTQVRALLAAGQLPPPQFSRPEVARLLIDAYQP